MPNRSYIRLYLFAALTACQPMASRGQKQVILQASSPYREWALQIPESDSGCIQLIISCDRYACGTISFSHVQGPELSEQAFAYRINMERPFYPDRLYADSTHHLKMSWNLRGSYLEVELDSTLQTICLMENDRPSGINSIHFMNQARRKDSAQILLEILDYSFSRKLLSEERKRIIAFGNSTTAFRRSITAVYAQRLPALLLDAGMKNHLINEGVPGSHSGHLVDNERHRGPHALDRFEEAVLAQEPDAVIICFGINDSWIDKGKESPRISREKFRLNLHSMIDALKSRKASVVLMTPNALGQRIGARQKDITAEYVQIVRDLADSENVALIDQWELFKQYGDEKDQEIDDLLLDGIHPNDQWHEMLAERLGRIIISQL